MQSWWKTLTVGMLLAATLGAQADEQAAQELNAQLRNIDDAEAHFTQHIIDTRGVRGKEFTGTMRVRRPGDFRWDTQTPYAQTIVTNGHKVWIYDPDLNQVIIESLDRQVGNTPALLLSSDETTIDHNFEVTQEKVSVSGESSYLLKPRNKDAMFEAMRIKFMQGVIEEMQLKDAMGQKTRIQFQRVHYHAHVDAAVFHFTPPKDAEIVQQ